MGVVLNRLKEICENFAHNRKIRESKEQFMREYPRIAESGLSMSEWQCLKFVIRRSNECRSAVIKNLDKMDFVETYFRLRAYNLEKKQKNEFLSSLEKSRILMIKTVFRVKLLDLDATRNWDPEIEKSDFEKALGDFPGTIIIPSWFIISIRMMRDTLKRAFLAFTEGNNRLIKVFALLFLISAIVSFIPDLGFIERVFIRMSAFASILAFLYLVLTKER